MYIEKQLTAPRNPISANIIVNKKKKKENSRDSNDSYTLMFSPCSREFPETVKIDLIISFPCRVT